MYVHVCVYTHIFSFLPSLKPRNLYLAKLYESMLQNSNGYSTQIQNTRSMLFAIWLPQSRNRKKYRHLAFAIPAPTS